MLEYEVVCARDHVEALEVQVTGALQTGWTPQGGICVTVDNGLRTYYQAMIRDEAGRRLAHSKRPKVAVPDSGD